ncbi:MAG: hypothetical protein JWO38_2243, partial [Gemmataceae bacterium]|nr:hypothetical protein [Gemmataceae bacterium]
GTQCVPYEAGRRVDFLLPPALGKEEDAAGARP